MLDIPAIVGKNIVRLREDRDWSQSYLAEQMNIAPQNMCGIESGKRGLSTKQITTICDVLGCLPEELFLIPRESNGDHVMEQLCKELGVMVREDKAELLSRAVSLNAARGIIP